MTRIELDAALKQADIECNNKKNQLYIKYRDDNAKAKIGDVVSNGTATILVTRVMLSIIYESMTIYYYGKKLKKNLEPYISGEHDTVSESATAFKIIKKAGDDGSQS